MTLKISPYTMYDGLTAVRLATTANISGTYSNGRLNNGVGATLLVAASSLTIDGVATAEGDRVLLKNQTSAYQNGIYEVTAIGSTVLLTRSFDFQCIEQMQLGQFVSVSSGTINSGSIFVLTTKPAALGVDTLTFSSPNAIDTGILSGTTTAYAGGGTSNAFTVTGLASTSTGSAVIRASTNAVSIAKAVPSTNTLTITFSADPGAGTTVDYIYFNA